MVFDLKLGMTMVIRSLKRVFLHPHPDISPALLISCLLSPTPGSLTCLTCVCVPHRTSLRYAPYISRGALTPSRSRQRAIVRCAATDTARRSDSTPSGSTPTTRQSR